MALQLLTSCVRSTADAAGSMAVQCGRVHSLGIVTVGISPRLGHAGLVLYPWAAAGGNLWPSSSQVGECHSLGHGQGESPCYARCGARDSALHAHPARCRNATLLAWSAALTCQQAARWTEVEESDVIDMWVCRTGTWAQTACLRPLRRGQHAGSSGVARPRPAPPAPLVAAALQPRRSGPMVSNCGPRVPAPVDRRKSTTEC